MSDFIPNSFQTPNDYVDQFMSLLTPEEWVVLSYTVRRIFGFQKRQDRISLSQYENGAKDREGNPLDRGTGLSRPAIIKALAALEKYGLQVLVEPNDKHKNEGACYALQLSAKKVNVAGLEKRAALAKERGRERTKTARANNPRHTHAGKSDLPPLSDAPVSTTNQHPVSPTYQQAVSTRSAPLTVPGKPHLPPPVSPTDTQNTGGNPGEIQTHTHGARAPSACRCKLPHGSEFCDEVRLAYGIAEPGITKPPAYAQNEDVRAGRDDFLIRAWLAEKENPPPERDITKCPDCRGSTWVEPGGPGKGRAKCKHPRLNANAA